MSLTRFIVFRNNDVTNEIWEDYESWWKFVRLKLARAWGASKRGGDSWLCGRMQEKGGKEVQEQKIVGKSGCHSFKNKRKMHMQSHDFLEPNTSHVLPPSYLYVHNYILLHCLCIYEHLSPFVDCTILYSY